MIALSLLIKLTNFQENDKNDRLPEWVCEICWIQTKTFHNFYKRLEFRHKNYSNSIALVNVDEIKRERSVSITEEVLEADLSLVKCIDETDALENVGIQTIKGTESCDEDKDDIIGDQSSFLSQLSLGEMTSLLISLQVKRSKVLTTKTNVSMTNRETKTLPLIERRHFTLNNILNPK